MTDIIACTSKEPFLILFSKKLTMVQKSEAVRVTQHGIIKGPVNKFPVSVTM